VQIKINSESGKKESIEAQRCTSEENEWTHMIMRTFVFKYIKFFLTLKLEVHTENHINMRLKVQPRHNDCRTGGDPVRVSQCAWEVMG